jgi:hypothetical protein
MNRTTWIAVAALTLTLPAWIVSAQQRTPAPKDAKVYIISPKQGETVSSPVRVVFGLRGAGVAPAGIEKENTGHHHLLVDGKLADATIPIPNDPTHLHYGGGQTEAEVTLAPGQHTLQLVLGDARHVPHDPPIQSEPITITVK